MLRLIGKLDFVIVALCVAVLLLLLGRWTTFEGTPRTLGLALTVPTTPMTYTYPLMVIAPPLIILWLLLDLQRLAAWRYPLVAVLGLLQVIGPAAVFAQTLVNEQSMNLIISPFAVFTGIYWLHLVTAVALAAACLLAMVQKDEKAIKPLED